MESDVLNSYVREINMAYLQGETEAIDVLKKDFLERIGNKFIATNELEQHKAIYPTLIKITAREIILNGLKSEELLPVHE